MRWLRRAGLVALGLALALGTLELGLRLVHPDPRILEPHDRLGSLARPRLDVRKTFGSGERVVRVTTNDLGLRGAAVAPGKPAGVLRVLALGDSFTFGAAVEAEEAWPAQLERALNAANAGRRWEVVNAGLPGHGTGQQLLLYRMLEPTLRPDVVVVGFAVVNDVLDNLCVDAERYRQRRDRPCFGVDGAGELIVTPPRATAIASAAPSRLPHSALGDALKASLRRLTLWNPSVIGVARRMGLSATLPALPETVGSWYDTEIAEPGWRLTERLLAELARAVEARGARLAVLIIPSGLQIDPALQQALRNLAGDDPAVQAFLRDPARPQRLLMDHCHRQRLRCVDPLPLIVRAQEEARQPYYPIDGHWTPLGHALAAGLVAERLGDGS